MNTRRNTGTKASTLARLAVVCLVVLYSLLPAQAQIVTTLVQFTKVWRYDQSGAELGTAWRTDDYDDSAWASGPGLLGFESTPAPYQVHAPLLTALTVSPAVTTFYFRTTFLLTGSTNFIQLYATNLVDDGSAIYLNGRLAGGVRMPSSFNATTTFSGPAVEGQLDVVALTNFLRPGLNQLAVEVHQAGGTSADILFGMRLMAFIPSALLITNQPQGQLVSLGLPVTLSVGVSGGPVSYRWQKDGVNLASTNSTLVIASAQLANTGNYQVICSNAVNVVTSDVARLTVVEDLEGPLATFAVRDNGFGPNRINVRFSEPVTTQSVRTIANYTLMRMDTSSTVTLTNVAYSDGQGALLFIEPSDPDWDLDADYFITINHVKDRRGNSIAPNTQIAVARLITNNISLAENSWNFHAAAYFDPEVYEQPWQTTNYVEGSWWAQGQGLFCGGPAVVTPCFGTFRTETGYQPEPILYRTTFLWPTNWPAAIRLHVHVLYDDALVLYLNGVEIYRVNTTAAGTPITSLTRASGLGTTCTTNLFITVANLLPGTNWLAAAVMQRGSGNDYASAFGVNRIHATTPVIRLPLSETPTPVLAAVAEGTNAVHLSWTGGGYALESSTNLDLGPLSYPYGPWRQVTNMANPYLWSLTNSSTHFFRLKK